MTDGVVGAGGVLGGVVGGVLGGVVGGTFGLQSTSTMVVTSLLPLLSSVLSWSVVPWAMFLMMCLPQSMFFLMV